MACTHKSRLLRQSLAANDMTCESRGKAIFFRRRHHARIPPGYSYRLRFLERCFVGPRGLFFGLGLPGGFGLAPGRGVNDGGGPGC
jgi:hypothetical protein